TVRVTEDERRTTKDESMADQSNPSSFVLRPSSSQELVVLDSAGRLQLPGEQRALAGIGGRARGEVVGGGILIRPADDPSTHSTSPSTSSGDTSGQASSGQAAEALSTDAVAADPTYQSLYSAEPPTNAINGTGKAKRGWRIGKAKRNAK